MFLLCEHETGQARCV